MNFISRAKKKIRREDGSYTIEACISLVVFLIAVMFVYMQIKTLICECIMQRAVNNMASEMSTYVYVLSRAGLIIDNKDDRFKDTDNIIEAGNDIKTQATSKIENFADIYSAIEVGDMSKAAEHTQEVAEDARSMVASIKKFAELVTKADWKKTAENGLRGLAENAIKGAANEGLSGFYNWKLDNYLPMEREKFCKAYLVDPDSISFEHSRIFPGDENNKVVVAVSYDVLPAFRMFPIKRKVVKVAMTAAWVESNTNNLKKEDK